MSSKQPFAFDYEFSTLGEFFLETKIAKKYPFLFRRMPFNICTIEAIRELAFFVNSDPQQKVNVPKGGGVIELEDVVLWNWKIQNLYNGVNIASVVVQKT